MVFVVNFDLTNADFGPAMRTICYLRVKMAHAAGLGAKDLIFMPSWATADNEE